MNTSVRSSLRSAPISASQTATPILMWALLGLFACALSFWVFGQWLLSDAFAPIPITEADAISSNALLLIRVVEVISTGVALWALVHYLVRPWLRTGQPTIHGLLLIGALISYVIDTSVNFGDYLMAWNKHAFNFGTWASFFPGHTGPTQYAEALFWGPPMYLYFGVALGTIQLFTLDRLQPKIGFATAFAVSFAVAFLFDFIAESVIIHAGAYAWPYTIGALTVWAGTPVQFPLYESLLVAIYASGYTFLMRSARTNGVSFIERGVDRLPSPARLPVRLLAATGFATLMTTIYFVGFYWFSQAADTAVTLPSYMMYVDANWAPSR